MLIALLMTVAAGLVDGVTEAYYDLLAELQSSDGETAPAAFGKVEQKLRNIADMEQMSIGSIL